MNKPNINPDFKPLEIREVFRKKNPRVAKLLPGFIYRYLHKVLVIDEINEVLRLHGHRKNLEFAKAAVDMFNVTVDVAGKEHIPDSGRFIFVSNHPLGGFDGVLLLTLIGEKFGGKVKVLVNDILMNIDNMDGVFFPINKHGGQAVEHVRELDRIFRSDLQVFTFPAGLVSRRSHGIIEDTEWKKSFVAKAVQFERDVIPMHITGRCTNFFYRMANLRKFLGIKSNLEMFYLPRETFRHKGNHYRVTIGKPIPYSTFDSSKKPLEWAQLVKRHCYNLAEDPGKEFTVTH